MEEKQEYGTLPTENKLNINWFSNAPWSATGYGNQTKLFAPRIKKAGYGMSITAFYGLDGHELGWIDGINIMPRGYDVYGQDVLSAHAGHSNSDVVITLMDAWVCDPEHFDPKVKWVPWFPIDSHPITQMNVDKLKYAYDRIVMSKHGAAMMDEIGMSYEYIPHGIDATVFKPMDRKEARKIAQLPEDRFIVGMVAANKGFPSRKAFAENILGFKLFHEKHPDSILYIHTSDGAHKEGFPLLDYLQFIDLELGRDVILAKQYLYTLSYPDQVMNALYNAFDVHLLVSKGEGFGIPIVEAQAAGCPVIVGGWSSMPELCFSGWIVPREESMPEYTQYGAWWFVPRPEAIAARLENAYNKKDNQIYRDRARAGALAYDVEKVMREYWLPYLEKLSEKIAQDEHREHTHEWSKIGLYNKDGSLSIPCLKCDDEAISANGQDVIVRDGFKTSFNNGVDLKLAPDSDGISKIVCREIKRDYDLDSLALKQGDTIVDIGAHKGIVSCYLAKRYPGVNVLAYEPNPNNFAALVKNIAMNEASTVTPYNLAVTGDGRRVNIEDNKDNSGGGKVIEGDSIGSVTLRDIIAEHGKIALLKIDCEGSEYEVLKDIELLKNVRHIRGEFHKSSGDPHALIEACKQYCGDVKVTVQG